MPSISTTLLTLSLAIFTTTSALPSASTPLLPRSCSVTYPTRMTELTRANQTSDSLSDFCVADSTRVRFVEFGNIPASATGACQLEFVFPPDYSVGGPGGHQVSVWKTDREIAVGDTWVSAPQPITTFGTVVLKSKAGEESRIVVNSGSCESMRHFKVGAVDGSTVAFTQAVPPAGVVAGMRIVYGC